MKNALIRSRNRQLIEEGGKVHTYNQIIVNPLQQYTNICSWT